jgi:hypothetical protein
VRISDDRYNRDRSRLDLALRFIRHEARTRTIHDWTGLTEDRIRKLYRSYLHNDSIIIRHRGKSPQQANFFTRTSRSRQESAVLASVCYMLEVMPHYRVADAQRHVPCIRRGEALCEAYETYRRLVPIPYISFEHAVFLVTALARGDELRASHCLDCCSLIIVDRLAMSGRRCQRCEDSLQGRLPFSF